LRRREAVFVEVGPASIVITGEKDGIGCRFDEAAVKRRLGRILAAVGECLPVLKQKGERIKKTTSLPPVARRMAEAVKSVDGVSLTPMAAVAGAVADELKEALTEEGTDFLSVNNGGDIAILNRSGRMIRIGVCDIGTGEAAPYTLGIRELKDYGLATSGFGGRSFTLGLADMVTVVAASGALADAAATFVCNRTNVRTDRVFRRKAAELDPNSDIADEWITASIGDLSDGLVKEALANGLESARLLKDRSIIFDAVIAFRGEWVTTIGGDKNIFVEAEDGDQKAHHDCRGHIR
jgi:uncharacterized protein